MNNVSSGTIARTIILALALINQVLSVLGYPVVPIEDETIEQLITSAITIIAAIAAWWKNNSFTDKAIAADETLEYLRGRD